MNQDKSLASLQQRISFIYGLLRKIWTALEVDKKRFQMKTQKLILMKKSTNCDIWWTR